MASPRERLLASVPWTLSAYYFDLLDAIEAAAVAEERARLRLAVEAFPNWVMRHRFLALLDEQP